MKDVIQTKLESYACKTAEEEENALKEISQEVALYALSKAGLFSVADFQGGTCLRIIHGLNRFSEDLDFSLRRVNRKFDLIPYIEEAKKLMAVYGYNIEVSGKDALDSNMRSRFLKDDSIKMLLNFQHYSDYKKKIKIKVEVDTNPPEGSNVLPAYIDFPTDCSISVQDLPSLFAGKCHALLCRNYTKGRDWYDFSWYVSRGILLNLNYLQHSLYQTGTWQGKNIKLDSSWLKENLHKRISIIKWKEVVRDVSRFIPSDNRDTLQLWTQDFFEAKIEKMKV